MAGNQWKLAQMLVGTKSIKVGILLIKYAQLYIIEKLASKSMKVGKLLKCILNQHFLAGY